LSEFEKEQQLIVALQSELATLKSVQTENSELRATIEVLKRKYSDTQCVVVALKEASHKRSANAQMLMNEIEMVRHASQA